jgi:hypothetical protein
MCGWAPPPARRCRGDRGNRLPPDLAGRSSSVDLVWVQTMLAPQARRAKLCRNSHMIDTRLGCIEAPWHDQTYRPSLLKRTLRGGSDHQTRKPSDSSGLLFIAGVLRGTCRLPSNIRRHNRRRWGHDEDPPKDCPKNRQARRSKATQTRRSSLGLNSDTATNLPISWQGRSALRVCVSMTYVVPLTLLHRSERILCGSAQLEVGGSAKPLSVSVGTR